MAVKAKKVLIEIDTRTVLKILLIIGGILLAIYLRAVVLIFLASFIVMAALKPAVDFLVSKKLNKNLSVFIVVFIGLILMGGLLVLVSLPLFKQLRVFVENFPAMVESIVSIGREKFPGLQSHLTPDKVQEFLNEYQSTFASILEGVWGNIWETLKTTFGILGSLLTVLTTFFLSVYMLIEHDSVVEGLPLLFHSKRRKRVRQMIEKVESKVGAWLRGQLLLCIVVGVLTWLVLSLLNIKYAAALGVLAGLLEVVPVLGPLLSAIPIMITGFSVGIWPGVSSLAAVFLIQQVENALLVPFIMKQAVGLNPVITLLAILIGGELFGIVGAVIAVPTAGIITVLVDEYLAARGIIIRKGIGRGDSSNEKSPK